MPQSIGRPFLAQLRPVPVRFQLLPQSNWADRPPVGAIGGELFAQIGLHRDETATGGFRIGRLYFDQARLEIDFRPIKPLDLRTTQPRKRAYEPVGERFGAGLLMSRAVSAIVRIPISPPISFACAQCSAWFAVQ